MSKETINELKKYTLGKKNTEKVEISVLQLNRFIKALKQKTGRWIDGDDKCPCCGKSKFEGLDADIWADWQPKYCPNCGAKMVEQEERDKE